MILDVGSMTSAATGVRETTLTYEGLIAAMKNAQREFGKLSPLIGGSLRVRESQYATEEKPARLHKRRRNQSVSYHLRVQKKWVKRWGTIQAPAAYLMDNSVIGMTGHTLVVHPSHMVAIRKLGRVG